MRRGTYNSKNKNSASYLFKWTNLTRWNFTPLAHLQTSFPVSHQGTVSLPSKQKRQFLRLLELMLVELLARESACSSWSWTRKGEERNSESSLSYRKSLTLSPVQARLPILAFPREANALFRETPSQSGRGPRDSTPFGRLSLRTLLPQFAASTARMPLANFPHRSVSQPGRTLCSSVFRSVNPYPHFLGAHLSTHLLSPIEESWLFQFSQPLRRNSSN